MCLFFLQLKWLLSYKQFCDFLTFKKLLNISGIDAATQQQKLAADIPSLQWYTLFKFITGHCHYDRKLRSQKFYSTGHRMLQDIQKIYHFVNSKLPCFRHLQSRLALIHSDGQAPSLTNKGQTMVCWSIANTLAYCEIIEKFCNVGSGKTMADLRFPPMKKISNFCGFHFISSTRWGVLRCPAAQS